MRIVLDTNVLMAALGTRGLCEALMAKCFDKHEVFASEYLLNEMATHLAAKFGFSVQDVADALAFVRKEARLVEPAPVTTGVCRDAKDLPVLGTAKAAAAEYLVTGDNDLLVLRHFEKTEIISPRQFYDKINEK